MAGCHHRRRHPSFCMKHRRRRRHHPYRPRVKSSQPQQQQEQRQQQQQQQQQAQREQHNSSGMEDSEYDDDGYIPVPLPLLDIGITSWLPLPELSGAWRWCSTRVTQSLDWVKDTVFPSRVYQRELQETKDQLMLLHHQIEQLKAHTLKVESDKPTPICSCNCQHLLPVPTHESAMPDPGAHHTAQPIQLTLNLGVQAGGNSAPTAPAVVPPPPPPPPISLPPKALVFKKTNTAKSLSQSTISNKRPMVTLSDIMNVKLKKVTTQNAKEPSNDPCNRRAMVTLTDIMNTRLRKTFNDRKVSPSGLCEAGKDDVKPVKLKKRRSVHQLNDENANTMVLRNRISEEVMQFRGCLRKVSLVRSPGGTPIRSRPKESHGTGLTPLMTKALRRKFRTIRTPSPQGVPSTSPSFNSSS